MIFHQLVLTLVGLSAFVDAHFGVNGIKFNKRESPLEVTLVPSPSENVAELVATIKNTGAVDLNLLRVGTILDDSLPVQKLIVLNDSGVEIPFRGIQPSIQYNALKSRHFQLLKAGESVTTTINAASVHHFEKSGTYSFTARGLMPLAMAPSAESFGPAATFESNTINLLVDAEAAALAEKFPAAPNLQERTHLQPGCNVTESAASTAALANCQKLALAAAADAADPSSKRFVEYFGTNSSTTRKIVVDRLTAVARECSTTDSGVSRYFCYDYYGVCEIDGPLNAYTVWDVDTMVMCPLFYNTLPPLPPGCHRQCQTTTVIHETTHCEDVYSPHTNDYAYAYNASVALPPERALLNADNYSLYANAVYLAC